MLPDKDKEDLDQENSGWDGFLFVNRKSILSLLIGFGLLGMGVLLFSFPDIFKSTKVEIVESGESSKKVATGSGEEIVVEIAGAVEKPGVYRFTSGSRVDDLLILAGGMSAGADRVWCDKYLNRASKLSDGQKVFIPNVNDRLPVKSDGPVSVTDTQNVAGDSVTGLININTASQKMLEELPGIGPVYAQSIIEHRVYSDVSELLTKEVLKKSTYEKIKELVTTN